jgi:Ras GTPase-activating protein 1
MDAIPPPKAARGFTLIAKTMQNLANLAEFGHKEPYMEPMNVLIHAKMAEMRTFIDAVAVCLCVVS